MGEVWGLVSGVWVGIPINTWVGIPINTKDPQRKMQGCLKILRNSRGKRVGMPKNIEDQYRDNKVRIPKNTKDQ